MSVAGLNGNNGMFYDAYATIECENNETWC